MDEKKVKGKHFEYVFFNESCRRIKHCIMLVVIHQEKFIPMPVYRY